MLYVETDNHEHLINLRDAAYIDMDHSKNKITICMFDGKLYRLNCESKEKFEDMKKNIKTCYKLDI